MTILPQEVYALVVGIEKYQAGAEWDLNGPANDAIKFTEWLLHRGVQPENISLFVSPLDKNRDLLPQIKLELKQATR